jgi:type I restriction enzyme, S subunit
LKEGWQRRKLGEVATLQRGFDLPVQKRVSGAYPLLSSSGISDTHHKSAVSGPGVVTGRSGSIGNVFYIEEDFWPLNTVLYVKDFHGNDPRFVFHLLKQFDLNRFATGAGVPTLNRNFVHDEVVSVPALSEQQRIVRILEEAFNHIAGVKANGEKNLQNSRALFETHLQSMFAMRGEGWVEKRLGDIAGTQYGLSEPMNEEGKGFRIFRMGELQGGRLIDTGRMKFANIDRTEFEKYKLRRGDVLFNRTNSFELVGKTGIFELTGEYCFASYLVRVILQPQVILSEFLNYFMNSEGFQRSVKQKASRSINQANINATILANECVRFPESLDVQRSMVGQLNSIRRETEHLESVYEKKLAALEVLKTSLLHQAFSGSL